MKRAVYYGIIKWINKSPAFELHGRCSSLHNVKELFLAIASLRSSGMTILLSEQFAKSALAVSDRAYIIEQGRVVLEGSSAALAKDPAVMAAYLG